MLPFGPGRKDVRRAQGHDWTELVQQGQSLHAVQEAWGFMTYGVPGFQISGFVTLQFPKPKDKMLRLMIFSGLL